MDVKFLEKKMEKPFDNCYWVIEGRFLAGEYPRNIDEGTSIDKIGSIVKCGVNCFIDLTSKSDGLNPYAYFFKTILNVTIKYISMPIPDFGIPTDGFMIQILDTIDNYLSSGSNIYIHCWGGIGRTGTVVGCWLNRHYCYHNVLLLNRKTFQEYWRNNPKSEYRRSPETFDQIKMVEQWDEKLTRSFNEKKYFVMSSIVNDEIDHVVSYIQMKNWDGLFGYLSNNTEKLNIIHTEKNYYGMIHYLLINDAPNHLYENMISLGADISIRNKDGKTAYDLNPSIIPLKPNNNSIPHEDYSMINDSISNILKSTMGLDLGYYPIINVLLDNYGSFASYIYLELSIKITLIPLRFGENPSVQIYCSQNSGNSVFFVGRNGWYRLE